MMQSCASAVKLRAAGPFSQSASVPCSNTASRHLGSSTRQSAESQRERRVCSYGRSACRTQDDALQCLAGGDKAPERDDQFACQSDDHGLARANTAIGGASTIPPCQRALLLKSQKAPGELDHAAADPGVGGSGEPLFAPFRAALVRRACQAGVARYCSAVTQWPREHLIDQDISRFDADADDPSQLPYHGVWLGLGLLLQSFLTSPLDLFDLADDEAQARHIALQLGRDIRRQHRALRRVQCCKTLRRLAQGWFEVANAQPGEGPLHSVDDARAFPDQALALPIGPLGVLFGNCRDARHRAVATFPTQPPQEPPLQ